ncbi:MAG: hypothetical protein C5B49_09050 [Bdellovibrio sp.]|nr:MAG: hypothetical protein C5B49_09050 [Bdellovibrio sp.]
MIRFYEETPYFHFSDPRGRRAILGFLALVLLIIWSPVFSNQFIMWDDDFNLYQNPIILNGSWKKFWEEPYMGFYIPLTYTIWDILASVFGLASAWPFALLNVIFLFVNSVLTFHFIRWLLRYLYPQVKKKAIFPPEEIDWAAFLGTLIFAFHPFQVGAVSWHSGFRDLMSYFWTMLCLITVLRSQKLFLAFVFFVLSLLSKPSSVTLSVTLMFLVYLLPGLRRKSWNGLMGAMLILGIAFSMWTHDIQSKFMIGLQSAAVPDRPFIMADTFGFYIRQFFGGGPLSADYGRTPPRVLEWGLWRETVPWLVVWLLALPLLFWKRWRELILFAALWIVPMAPTSGVIPFNYQRISSVADHYFIPALPAFGFLAAFLYLWPPAWLKNWPALKKVPVLNHFSIAWLIFPAMVVWGMQTHLRIQDWHDSETFFHSIINTHPYSHSANNYLGYFAFGRGDWKEAEKYFRQATASLPVSAISSGNLGYALLRQGRNAEVVAYLQTKVVDPDFIAQNMVHQHVIAVNYLALGLAQANLGRFAEAFHNICEMFKYSPQPNDAKDGYENLERLKKVLNGNDPQMKQSRALSTAESTTCPYLQKPPAL